MCNKVLILLMICFLSCNSERKQNEVVSNDRIALSERIVMEFEPDSVLWSEVTLGNPVSRVPGPVDGYIVCILSYDSANFEMIKSRFEGHERVNDRVYLKPDFRKDWFPASVRIILLCRENSCG